MIKVYFEPDQNSSIIDKNADYIKTKTSVIRKIKVKTKNKTQKKLNKIIKNTLDKENVSVIYE